MKFRTRVGILMTAGLLTCGVTPAAQATAQQDSQTAAPTATSQLPPTEPTPTLAPTPEPSSPDHSISESTMECSSSVGDQRVTISFVTDLAYDHLTVTVDQQDVTPLRITEDTVILDQPERQEEVLIELWRDESLIQDCTTTIEPAPEPEPSEAPDEATTPPPTPDPSDTAVPTPPPAEPTLTVPPSLGATPTPTPSLTVPAPAPSEPSVPETNYSTAEPPPGATVEPDREAPSSVGPSSAPAEDRPLRSIRQYPADPRYLLPRLFGTDSLNGSRLVMPQPRPDGQRPVELETLPPVSEDELNAIKARLSSPNRANHPGSSPVQAAPADDVIFQRSAMWVTAIGGLLLLTVLIWWLRARRGTES